MSSRGFNVSNLKAFVERRPIASGALVYLILTVALFADVLLAGNSVVLSMPGKDIALSEVYGRDFAFNALRHGSLGLWDKYLYSGCPFFSQAPSPIFYPFNWLNIIFPSALSINLIIVIHVYLTGFFMFLWAHRRGLSFPASLFTGILLMFGGSYFLHILAGHVTNLCAMTWVPLLLIAADMLLERLYAMGILLGVFGLVLQILAGQPQYSYYTIITLALYMAVNLATRHPVKACVMCVLAMIVIGAAAVAICAIDLLPVIDQFTESSRGGGVSSSFAGMLSFPPENFLTTIAPTVFGDLRYAAYWGRWNLWEMSLYIGVTGLILAVYGMMASTATGRKTAIVMAVALGVLALGSHTPLFGLLFNYFPGFNKFRGTSKFAFDAMIFVVLLAGMGLDALIAGSEKARNLAIAVAIGAVLCLLAGNAIGSSAGDGVSGPIGSLLTSVHSSGETYVDDNKVTDSKFIAKAAVVASTSLYVAAVLLALNAGMLWLRPKRQWLAYLMVALGVVEVFGFAAYFRSTFPTGTLYNRPLQTFLDKNLGDGRILIIGNPNEALALRKPAIWGYDSFNLNRYAEFVAYATGGNPDNFDNKAYPTFPPSRLLALVRLKYAIDHGHISPVTGPMAPLPHISLMQQWVTIQGRNAIFTAMGSGSMNLAKMAILESKPDAVDTHTPAAAGPGPAGAIGIVRDTGDSMEFSGDVLRPSMLLITDSYAKGWQARPLAGSEQGAYQVMPADYTLRAIPLGPGHQHFMLEFVPAGLATGKSITLAALALYAAGLVWFLIVRRQRLMPNRGTKEEASAVTEPVDN